MEQNRQFVDSEFVKLSDEPILNANFIKTHPLHTIVYINIKDTRHGER